MPVLNGREWGALRVCSGAFAVLVAAALAPSSANADAPRGRAAAGKVVFASALDPSLGAARAGYARLSADGRVVAFDAAVPASSVPTQAYARDLRSGSPAQLVSVAVDGGPADADARVASVSTDGRFVAFWSAATNLVAGDTNGVYDVFVRDRVAGTTSRVSVGSAGEQATGDSTAGFMSADGNRVAFMSKADNLVPADTNRRGDVFVRDLTAGTTRRVSLAPGGAQSAWPSHVTSISADGDHVAFMSTGSDLADPDSAHRYLVYVHHLRSGRTEIASVDRHGRLPDGRSLGGSLSGNGRFVAFASSADDLVSSDPGRDTDVYVRDLKRDRNEIVSVRRDGSSVNKAFSSLVWDGALSYDGRFVAFSSSARLLPGQPPGNFIRDRRTDTTTRVTSGGDLRLAGVARRASFTSGRVLVDADTDGLSDVYVTSFR
ncbi:TolB family protein [Nocardioides iriomotensis]|uniref:Calcium-binding protein n=1 Tax=Nocardioides iriomotensis TaxID=715784 RepID=A0A4Q5IUH9_9ACTN|nr:hypothetical protein [Nocardioides iriomotensis]RYU09550.1 hypothetical protein ETU37_21140 [Nocardioides iriomotensis]